MRGHLFDMRAYASVVERAHRGLISFAPEFSCLCQFSPYLYFISI